MKKTFRQLITLSLIMLMTIASAQAVFAAEGNYNGNTNELTVDGMFSDFTNMVPGDTASQQVAIKVNPESGMNTNIYLRAEASGDNVLLKDSTLSVKQGTRTLYSGKASDLNTNVLIGTFTGAGTGTISVELTLPTSLGNEAADQQATVNWIFTAEEVPVPADDDDDDGGAGGGNGGGGGAGGGGAAGAGAGVDGAAVIDADATDIPDDGTPTADFTEIDDEDTPMAEGEGSWALLNLISAVAAAAGAIVAFFRRKEDDEYADEDDGRNGKMLAAKAAGGLAGIASVITFFLTEDMSQAMTLIDKWTPLMLVMLAVQVVSAILNKKASEADIDSEAA